MLVTTAVNPDGYFPVTFRRLSATSSVAEVLDNELCYDIGAKSLAGRKLIE